MPTTSPPSNLDEMKQRLGPLGWATRSLDGFLKVSHFDDFLARIHHAGRPDFFASALEQADIKARLATLSCDPAPATPEAFATRVGGDVARWKKLAAEKNIRAD